MILKKSIAIESQFYQLLIANYQFIVKKFLNIYKKLK